MKPAAAAASSRASPSRPSWISSWSARRSKSLLLVPNDRPGSAWRGRVCCTGGWVRPRPGIEIRRYIVRDSQSAVRGDNSQIAAAEAGGLRQCHYIGFGNRHEIRRQRFGAPHQAQGTQSIQQVADAGSQRVMRSYFGFAELGQAEISPEQLVGKRCQRRQSKYRVDEFYNRRVTALVVRDITHLRKG